MTTITKAITVATVKPAITPPQSSSSVVSIVGRRSVKRHKFKYMQKSLIINSDNQKILECAARITNG